MAMRGFILVALFAVLSISATPGIAQEKDEGAKDPPPPVAVDSVRRDPLAQKVPVIGRLVASQTGVVAAAANGPVAVIGVRVGDRVEPGQVVASLVKERLDASRELSLAEITQAEAALGTARAKLRLLQQELNRLEKLRRSAAFSQAKLQDKQAEVAQARSEIAESRAALERAKVSLHLSEIDLYNADVRAPYAGVVSQRHTEVGSYLSVGAPVVTLIDDQNLEISADVPFERIGGLVPGTEVELSLDDGIRAVATVRAVVPEENPLTRTRTVRFQPDFGDGARNLAANQSVTLMIPAGEAREVLTVHKDAVLNRKGKTLVYVVQDGKAMIRPVQLGEATGSRFVVERGLAPGDEVVVRGNERLRPGQEVAAKRKPAG